MKNSEWKSRWLNLNIIFQLPYLFLPIPSIILLPLIGTVSCKCFRYKPKKRQDYSIRQCFAQFFSKKMIRAHCSYLDIYISRKIRLCVVDLEDKFQTSLEAKLINFLTWKFISITLIFLLFFAEFVKSTAFYTLLLLF